MKTQMVFLFIRLQNIFSPKGSYGLFILEMQNMGCIIKVSILEVDL